MADNTLSRPGEFDALEKARPDELLFPLLERDPDAPPTILFWVSRRRARAFASADLAVIDSSNMPDKLADELRQCAEAEQIAIEMLSRQKGGKAEAIAKATSYSGNTRPEAEIEGKMTRLRGKLGDCDYHGHEALPILAEIIALAPDHIEPRVAAEIEAAIGTIHRCVLELSPHRAAYLAEGELPLPSN